MENKPREFWFVEKYANACDLHDYEPDSFNSVHNEHIHVIEYAAFEKLREENSKILDGFNFQLKERVKSDDKITSLLSIIKRQQVALEFYSKENNYYTDDRGNRSDSIGYNVDLITEDMGITARETLTATKEELEKLEVSL